MISQKIVSSVKNAIGTACLLLGAFLVCSTFVSMRTVLADPIAPINDPMVLMQQQVATGNARGAALRESPRNGAASYPRKRNRALARAHSRKAPFLP